MKQRKNLIVVLLAAFAAFGTSSCTKFTNRIKGQGPVVQQSYDLPPISAISLSIDANVTLIHGDSQSVVIEGQQNIINNIEKHVSSQGLWSIGYYHPVVNHAGVRIRITAPTFDYARISGSGNIETANHFPDSTHVYLGISGSGNISMSTDANTIESEISGSGQVFLNGSAKDHNINISGSGNVRAFGLETRNASVRISGSGNSEVRVSEYMHVTLSGSGNVYYKGNPDIDANISGSGTILNWN